MAVQPESQRSSTSRTTRPCTGLGHLWRHPNAPTTLASLWALLCTSPCGRRAATRQACRLREPADPSHLRRQRADQSRMALRLAWRPRPPAGSPTASRAACVTTPYISAGCSSPVGGQRGRQPIAPSRDRTAGRVPGPPAAALPSAMRPESSHAGGRHPGGPGLLDAERHAGASKRRAPSSTALSCNSRSGWPRQREHRPQSAASGSSSCSRRKRSRQPGCGRYSRIARPRVAGLERVVARLVVAPGLARGDPAAAHPPHRAVDVEHLQHHLQPGAAQIDERLERGGGAR